MVAKFNGKGGQPKGGGSKPAGKPASQKAQKIESRYSKQKQIGNASGKSAHAGV